MMNIQKRSEMAKLTLQPSMKAIAHLEELREVGINDPEMLLTVHMNCVSCIAAGLDVQHDEQEAQDTNTEAAKPFS
jgi:hypothetical protein